MDVIRGAAGVGGQKVRPPQAALQWVAKCATQRIFSKNNYFVNVSSWLPKNININI